MFGLTDGLSELFHLQQLSFDHLLRETDEEVEHAEVALLKRNFESLHVKPVAGQNAFGVAPACVGRRTSSPCLGFIDDVIMNQRGRMNDLYHGSQADRTVS